MMVAAGIDMALVGLELVIRATAEATNEWGKDTPPVGAEVMLLAFRGIRGTLVNFQEAYKELYPARYQHMQETTAAEFQKLLYTVELAGTLWEHGIGGEDSKAGKGNGKSNGDGNGV